MSIPPTYSQETGQPPPYGPSAVDYPYHPPQLDNGLAIGAMVTGIVGLILTPTLALYLIGGPLGLVMGPTAMALGWIGRRRARRGVAKDESLALIGLILGAVTFVLGIAASLTTYWLYSGDWD